MQVLYGHKARVWDAKFLGQFIVSIGEDATCIVWDRSSELVKKFKGHEGSISCCLFCCYLEKRQYAAHFVIDCYTWSAF